MASIKDYLGEEEASLADFIIEKIKLQTSPQELVENLKDILDNESEPFVEKLWSKFIAVIMKRKLSS